MKHFKAFPGIPGKKGNIFISTLAFPLGSLASRDSPSLTIHKYPKIPDHPWKLPFHQSLRFPSYFRSEELSENAIFEFVWNSHFNPFGVFFLKSDTSGAMFINREASNPCFHWEFFPFSEESGLVLGCRGHRAEGVVGKLWLSLRSYSSILVRIRGKLTPKLFLACTLLDNPVRIPYPSILPRE